VSLLLVLNVGVPENILEQFGDGFVECFISAVVVLTF
jgi:hypothetical protein